MNMQADKYTSIFFIIMIRFVRDGRFGGTLLHCVAADASPGSNE